MPGIAPALLGLVFTANRLMSQEALRIVPEVELTPPQFRILNFLLNNPGCSLSDVATSLGVRLPTASVMLVRLGADGLVSRSRDPISRRRMQLALTEHGRTVILAVRRALFARIEARLEGISEEEKAALHRALPALHQLFAEA
ncbi:MarR family transcriptional regulator [Belnapia sp. T6]|uniref:MarR family transcriptional regulator n=1 Tax=Belnapia mucosa TaxID=2804532 RepID=A0ABS1UXV8_9PROT|nr:MarR family transcriptional regulator [Belnapia mucosa]MBL6454304.1 MarR family transcriptional regulator [Belnapia mucosa]